MEKEIISGKKVSENIYLCPDGKYRWTYEFNMLKNPVILFTVFRVMGMAAAIVALFVLAVDFFDDFRLEPMSPGDTKIMILVILFMAFVVVISYLILAKSYGWKYLVLFEMDDKEVRHIQMPSQFEKARALGWLSVMAGIATGNPGIAGRGLLTATKNSSTSVLANVRQLIGQRRMQVIKVNMLLDHNQIYADGPDYDFVWEFLKAHCPQAKVRG